MALYQWTVCDKTDTAEVVVGNWLELEAEIFVTPTVSLFKESSSHLIQSSICYLNL